MGLIALKYDLFRAFEFPFRLGKPNLMPNPDPVTRLIGAMILKLTISYSYDRIDTGTVSTGYRSWAMTGSLDPKMLFWP